ncbi:MAG: metal-dependent hydrolase [Thermoplasmata archaeon HGW-Thermoplasmata-1]|nr:MAG: metal-dependent hydrolase [Thermoplasmata archaeon HGW-Thermoplasmata-1]
MQRLPILDNHLHFQWDGKNSIALKEFEKAGGTHAIFAHMPNLANPPKNADEWKMEYDSTLRLADRMRLEVPNVTLYVTVAPYPVQLIRLVELGKTLEEAKLSIEKGMGVAARLFEEKRIIALGEMGRPHFPVEKNILDACNETLEYGMRIARDIGCPIVLHTESGGEEVFCDIARMADGCGMPREKIVKHYSSPIVGPQNHGIFPSILADKDAICEAISVSPRFLMETDYMDDPKRPGAVLAPKTVPKRTMALFESGLFTENDVYRIHKENPESVYGVSFEA